MSESAGKIRTAIAKYPRGNIHLYMDLLENIGIKKGFMSLRKTRMLKKFAHEHDETRIEVEVLLDEYGIKKPNPLPGQSSYEINDQGGFVWREDVKEEAQKDWVELMNAEIEIHMPEEDARIMLTALETADGDFGGPSEVQKLRAIMLDQLYEGLKASLDALEEKAGPISKAEDKALSAISTLSKKLDTLVKDGVEETVKESE